MNRDERRSGDLASEAEALAWLCSAACVAVGVVAQVGAWAVRLGMLEPGHEEFTGPGRRVGVSSRVECSLFEDQVGVAASRTPRLADIDLERNAPLRMACRHGH